MPSPSASQCHCPGCGTQRLLRCRLHPAGRCPNSSSLFPPLAAVVAVAPKGRGTGVPVRPTRDEQSLLYPKTVVPCYRGQQLRDNIPCQAAVNLCSRALYFMPYWAFSSQRKAARHASGSPFGGNGDDRRQRRKQGGAVGAAASRMQATAKQTLGAATRPWRAERD